MIAHSIRDQLEITLHDNYFAQAVGINALKKIVSNFCSQAGFQGQYSNHSEKVTCATKLLKNNVD